MEILLKSQYDQSAISKSQEMQFFDKGTTCQTSLPIKLWLVQQHKISSALINSNSRRMFMQICRFGGKDSLRNSFSSMLSVDVSGRLFLLNNSKKLTAVWCLYLSIPPQHRDTQWATSPLVLPVPLRFRRRRCWPAGCRTRRLSWAGRLLRAGGGSWRDPARSSETGVWEEEAATEASLSAWHQHKQSWHKT